MKSLRLCVPTALLGQHREFWLALAPRKSKLRRIPVLKTAQNHQKLRVLGQSQCCPGRDGHWTVLSLNSRAGNTDTA